MDPIAGSPAMQSAAPRCKEAMVSQARPDKGVLEPRRKIAVSARALSHLALPLRCGSASGLRRHRDAADGRFIAHLGARAAAVAAGRVFIATLRFVIAA